MMLTAAVTIKFLLSITTYPNQTALTEFQNEKLYDTVDLCNKAAQKKLKKIKEPAIFNCHPVNAELWK